MNSYLIVGALLLFAGAVAFAFRTGVKQGSAEGDKKLEAAEDASRRKFRQDSIRGQGIQQKARETPIDVIKAKMLEDARKAKK